MNSLRFFLPSLVCLLAQASMVWPAPVPGARSGLEHVPDTAPIVIHFRGVQGIHQRFTALMKQALPDLLDKYREQIDDFFEKGPDNILKNRKLRGLAKDGPIFYAFLELPNPNNPDSIKKLAIIAAVSNYKEFRDNLLTEEERKNVKDEGNGIESAVLESTPIYFVDRKGYAVLTPDKEVAESFTKRITGLHTKISKDQAAKLISSDVGVYVNMETVNKEYGEQIKQAKQGIEQGIAFGAAAADESQRRYTEMLKKAIDPIFQTIDDMQSVLLTFELRPGGLALHLQSEMKESSSTANFLRDTRPVAFDELKRLPRDHAFYLGIKTSAALNELLGSIISGLPSEEAKASADMWKELAKTGPNIILNSSDFPSPGLGIYHFDDPNKAVAAVLKMFRNLDPAAAKLKEKPVVKTDAEKFGDFKLHSVQFTLDHDKIAEQAAARGGEDAKKQYIEAMKGILGEKKTMWFGTDGKTVVRVTAPDWDTARKLLEQYSKGANTADEVKAFRDVRKEMPARVSFLLLGDLVNVFGSVFEAIRPIIPGGQLPPGWPNKPAKGTSSYVGMAVTLQPGRGSLDLFITTSAAQEFYKAVIRPLVGE